LGLAFGLALATSPLSSREVAPSEKEPNSRGRRLRVRALFMERPEAHAPERLRKLDDPLPD
jgi:hypothetical protein